MTKNQDNQHNPYLEQIQEQFFTPKEEASVAPKRKVSQEAFDRLKAPEELMNKIKREQLEQSAIEEETFDGTISIFKRNMNRRLSQAAEEVERNFYLVEPLEESDLPPDIEEFAVSMGLKELYTLEYHMKDTVIYTEHVKSSVNDLRNLLIGNFSAMEGYEFDPNLETLRAERKQYIQYLYEKYKNTQNEIAFPSLKEKPKTTIQLSNEQEQAAVSYAVSNIEKIRQQLKEFQASYLAKVQAQSPVLYDSFLKSAIEDAFQDLHASLHPLLADAKFLAMADYERGDQIDRTLVETFHANRLEFLYKIWTEMQESESSN
jgi:hypothetical protein